MRVKGPRYGNPIASYPVIRFGGFYIENLWKGSEMGKEGGPTAPRQFG